MKKLLTILIIFVFTFSLFGCVKKDDKVASGEFKIFRNETFGFELKYPENWNLYDGTEGTSKYYAGVVITPYDEDYLFDKSDGSSMGIDKSSNNKYTPKEWADRYIINSKAFKTKPEIKIIQEDILLDSQIEAVKVVMRGMKLAPFDTTSNKEPVEGISTYVFFRNNNLFFSVLYIYPSADETKYKQNFENIISSIKFIE